MTPQTERTTRMTNNKHTGPSETNRAGAFKQVFFSLPLLFCFHLVRPNHGGWTPVDAMPGPVLVSITLSSATAERCLTNYETTKGPNATGHRGH